MYCGQCGKKVMENMLFCPFCGSPIVIPEQDEPEQAPATPVVGETEPVETAAPEEIVIEEAVVEEAVPEEPAPAEEPVREKFVPLSFSFDALDEGEPEADAPAEEKPLMEEKSPIEKKPKEPAPEKKPARKPKAKPSPSGGQAERKRTGKTFIPVKDIDPDDLFMDGSGAQDEDEYDLIEDYDSGFDEEFSFEEPEEGSFFQRHIRGIVGLILLVVLALVVVIWAHSSKGQIALARVNLAWDAETYADLGYEAYHQNSDLLAAKYYEKALARDPENYDYAHSAMVAYYEADKIESAASMLKKCVEMRPDSVQPYQEMLILYPDAQKRPWEISELIRMGYERTGDSSLIAN